MLSQAEHERVSAAVAAAECSTSAELLCALAHEVSDYREIPIAWGAAAALVLPPLAFVFGLNPAWLSSALVGWTAAQASALGSAVRLAIAAYALIQALTFSVVAVIVTAPPVRRVLTPRFLKRHRVRKAALHYFASAAHKTSSGRPALVIFASLADRQVELVTDQTTHRAIGAEVSNQAVKAVVDGMRRKDPASGFERAVAICGEALAKAFPSNGEASELPDALQEL